MAVFSFTVLDFLLGIVVIASAAYATYRGILRETLSIFSWALALWSTISFYPTFLPLLREHVHPEWLADTLTALAIFLIVLIPLSFLSHRFSQTVQRSEVGPVDRTLGFVFGVGRGLVIAGLAYIAFSYFVPVRQHPQWLTEARSLPIIQSTADILLDLVPNSEHTAVISDVEDQDTVDDAPVTSKDEAKKPDKTYGKSDRRALDRLIETTGK